LREVATAINDPGGQLAVNLRVAEQWVKEFGRIAQASNTMIIPANLSDVAGMVATALKAMQSVEKSQTSGS